MPELGSYGSVRGARGNSRPYRESERPTVKTTRLTHLGRQRALADRRPLNARKIQSIDQAPPVPRSSSATVELLNGKGRVEDGRGSLGHSATLRFPSPLIEPDVPVSGIRLSDWLHRKAHGTNH